MWVLEITKRERKTTMPREKTAKGFKRSNMYKTRREIMNEIARERATNDALLLESVRVEARWLAQQERASAPGETDETRARRASIMRAFGIENPKHASTIQKQAINDLRNAR
jgi:hypothetical protein